MTSPDDVARSILARSARLSAVKVIRFTGHD
jgi:hypothetical protein